MKLLNNPLYYFVAIIISLLILTTSITISSFNDIDSKRIVIQNLYQLKSDILYANIALRNSTISGSKELAELELAKMLVTRGSANLIYDKLTIEDLSKSTRIVFEEMKKERPEYRNAQLKVVANIRNGDSKKILWFNMSYYQTLMDRYTQRVDWLINSINNETNDLIRTTKRNILLLTFFSSTIVLIMTRRHLYKICLRYYNNV